jgi:hypothetical protein
MANATPQNVDEPSGSSSSKVEEYESLIRVDGKPVPKKVPMSYGKMPRPMSYGKMPPPMSYGKMPRPEKSGDASDSSKTNAMGDTYAKGGMTASKRADGIAQRGKTKGTMVMCGGGMARGGK